MATASYSYGFDKVSDDWVHFITTSKTVSSINAGVTSNIPKYATIDSVQAKFKAWKLAATTVDLWVESCTTAGSESGNLQLYYGKGSINSDHNSFAIDISSSYYNSKNASAGQLKGLRKYLQYRIGHGSLWHQLYIEDAELKWNYTQPTLRVSVEASTGGSVSGGKTINIAKPGTTYTADISATPDTGYRFVKWSDGSTTRSRTLSFTDSDLTKTNTEVSYTAEFAKTPYIINTATRIGTSSTSLSNATVSGGGTYYIGDRFTLQATTTAFAESPTESYIFDYWTLEANGSTLLDGQTFTNNDLRNLQLNASRITSWFASGTTITAVAHFRRVYFLTLNVVDADGHTVNGLNKVAISYTDASGTVTENNNVATGTQITAYSKYFTVRVYLQNTTQAPDEYAVHYYFDNMQSNRYFANPDSPTPQRDGRYLHHHLCAELEATTSDATITLKIFKQYYSITLTDNTDNAVKVYRNGSRISPDNLAHMLRDAPAITIDATEAATKDTKYNAVLKYGGSNVSGNIYTISNLSQDYTFTVETSLVQYTMTKTIVGVDGQQSTTTRQISRTEPIVDTQGNVFFTVSAGANEKIATVEIIKNNGTIEYSDSDLEETTFSYPVASASAPLTFTAVLASSTSDYVYLKTGRCLHGTVQTGVMSILKRNFTSFQYNGTNANDGYEVVTVTYQWFIHDSNGSESSVGNAITMPTNGIITYPGSINAIPAGQYPVCYINVVFRKNLLYLSKTNNGVWSSRTPRRIYYSTSPSTTKEIIAVYVQMVDHTAPILLYGDADNI